MWNLGLNMNMHTHTHIKDTKVEVCESDLKGREGRYEREIGGGGKTKIAHS